MINKSLLKATIKQNYIVLLIIVAVLMIYMPTIVSMYNPKMQDSLNEMIQMLPKQMTAAMGFSGAANTLLSFVATLMARDGSVVAYTYSYFLPGYFRFHVVRRVG
jgi:hypothetical protein